ncbi:DUF2934 domain-containing protein [Thermosulfuriphilus ammonigenes]|uniref:DUF2934 domain-containing protein n=1 Tax=Thermosulfuriphilus ammonigenes TaxID=1936021 RepID=A0A6G7PVY5_9BACT|nr:DUF5335 family protein [Thermosulfuriphilus ammonigenes]MBA2848224.1 uncharacterized protein (DUF1697 family) [Thermosulfuriphilus ammonigenes]QIJ71608.1 DUF2934 domain-containing protein [Thermosulfuriphilus ammonigenes]
MKKERILKKEWKNFLKEFNGANQFRPVRLLVDEHLVAENLPFMGIAYEEKTKTVEFYVGGMDADHIDHLIHSLRSPRAIYALKEDGRLLGLEVQSAKDPKAAVEFIGEPEEAQRTKHELIQKIAYSLYEKRGREAGREKEDWYQAEELVAKMAKRFI